MTKKQKRRWLMNTDLTGAAAAALFTAEELASEHERRGRHICRWFAITKDGNNAPAGYRKKFKRGTQLERIPTPNNP